MAQPDVINLRWCSTPAEEAAALLKLAYRISDQGFQMHRPLDIVGVPQHPNIIARIEWLSDHHQLIREAVDTTRAVLAIEDIARWLDPLFPMPAEEETKDGIEQAPAF